MMLQRLRSPTFWAAFAILTSTAAMALLLPGIGTDIFSRGNFMPHGHCYLQNSRLIWLHVISDSLIGLAYLAISASLAYLVYRARRDIPFHWMFLAFGLFIVTCGFTHWMEVWTVWDPVYWLSGDIKMITAVASVSTAIALPPLIPRVFQMIRSARVSEERKTQLERKNDELTQLYAKVKELDALKSQFFANVSHELRTPLSLILGPAQQMAADRNLTSAQQHDLQVIARNASLLLKHVNDLLDTAQFDAGRMALHYSDTDLVKLVRLSVSYFETLAVERRITLSFDAPDHLPAQVDTEKLQRVVFNLLSNAFKFAPEGGRIDCRVHAQGEQIMLEIADNGPGIPPALREAVFDRFRQVDGETSRRFGGTGLGLSIAKDFIDMHHGEIGVDQAPGGGALFRVRFPAKAPTGTVVEPEPAPASPAVPADLPVEPGPSEPLVPPSGGEGRVLVVEDNPEMNQFIAELLATRYTVFRAANGRDGMRAALEHQPDLILTDVMMPEMDGETFLRQIRQELSLQQTPVIFLSAKADDESRIRLLQQGADDYVLKPFSNEELKLRVANVMAIHKTCRTLQREIQSQSANLGTLVQETVERKRQLEAALESQRSAEEALRQLNDELERRVHERTNQLEASHEEMEAFTYSVSHDLRAPLRAMQGMAQALDEDWSAQLHPEAKDYLRRITAATGRMESLIHDLLEYSQISRRPVDLEPVDLATVVRECQEQLEGDIAGRRAQLQVELGEDFVLGNRTLLSQAIGNLLSNALKFTAPETTPRIQVVSRRSDDGWVRLSVADNGIGIEDRYQERIFRVFERLHSSETYPGTGIGLAIVAKAISKMNGKLGLKSEIGQGSAFWLELRASASDGGRPPQAH